MADNSLLEKVLGLQAKYDGLQAQLSDPEVISDMKRFVQLNKEYKELTPIIEAGNEFKKIIENYEMAKDILANEKDEDLREMAKEEIAEIEPTLPEWEEKIKLLLIPADPQDSKNAILEIRGGSGGDEAAIFAGDLSVCTQSISRHAVGKWKSQIRQKVQLVDSRKSFARCQVMVYMESLSMSQVFTVFSVCLRQKLRVVYIHLLLQWQCFQRLTSLISSLT